MALNRFFGLSPELPRELRSNIIHYYFDISWWGLYGGATAAFLTIYATRLRATPAQIGLLSALPAGITLLLSLPFANLVLRMGAHRATWMVHSLPASPSCSTPCCRSFSRRRARCGRSWSLPC